MNEPKTKPNAQHRSSVSFVEPRTPRHRGNCGRGLTGLFCKGVGLFQNVCVYWGFVLRRTSCIEHSRAKQPSSRLPPLGVAAAFCIFNAGDNTKIETCYMVKAAVRSWGNDFPFTSSTPTEDYSPCDRCLKGHGAIISLNFKKKMFSLAASEATCHLSHWRLKCFFSGCESNHHLYSIFVLFPPISLSVHPKCFFVITLYIYYLLYLLLLLHSYLYMRCLLRW